MRHAFIPAVALVAMAAVLAPAPARATEAIAAVPKAGEFFTNGKFLGDGVSLAERERLGQRLQRDRFTIVGDLRRKGSLIILLALQDGTPWRLVVDAPTGEIIGRRPLSETVALPR